jgi:hypothetical protein
LANGIVLEDSNQEVDVYDMAQGVDIISNFGPEWQDKILEIKKWSDKKQMLEELQAASNTTKIKNGDFMPIIKVLKKLLGDSNTVVS